MSFYDTFKGLRSSARRSKTEKRGSGLLDLTNFIEDKMILVNDPLEVVGQYDNKSPETSEISETTEDSHICHHKGCCG